MTEFVEFPLKRVFQQVGNVMGDYFASKWNVDNIEKLLDKETMEIVVKTSQPFHDAALIPYFCKSLHVLYIAPTTKQIVEKVCVGEKCILHEFLDPESVANVATTSLHCLLNSNQRIGYVGDFSGHEVLIISSKKFLEHVAKISKTAFDLIVVINPSLQTFATVVNHFPTLKKVFVVNVEKSFPFLNVPEINLS